MLYVASSHPPSAQLQALSLPFFSPSQSTLVINKLNRIEFYDVAESDGRLALREEVAVNAGVAVMEKVQLENHPTASLLVLTTSLQLFLLSFVPTTNTISTLSSISIHEPFARQSEYQAILVSPCGSAALVYAYDGLVRVVPLRADGADGGSAGKKGKKRRASAVDAEENQIEGAFDLSRSYNVRLQHLNVLSLAFVPPPSSSPSGSDAEDSDAPAAVYPALSVLSLSPISGHKTLTTYTLSLANREFDDSTAPMGEVELDDQGSEIVLPWTGAGEGKERERGVVVVGEESVSFFGVDAPAEGKKGKGKGKEGERTPSGGRKVVARVPLSRVTAFAQLSPTTLLLGDLYGKLLLATISPSLTISIQDLGDATSATSIVPLSSSLGLVYLASRFGDSQVVRLPPAAFGSEGGEKMQIEGEEAQELELVESFTGLAPILDAVPLGGGDEDEDEGNESSAASTSAASSSLLLLSGAFKTGSLRLLRRGLALNELAALEIEGVQRVWGVSRQSSEGENEALLVVGFFGETRVFKLSLEAGDGAEGEEVDLEELEDIAPFASAGSGAGEASLLAANVGSLLVHVTPSGVSFAPSGGASGSEGKWAPEGGKKKVTAAVARGAVVALAVEGGEVVVLEAKDEGLAQVGSTTFPTDISALALSSGSDPSHLAVALWTPSQTVHLLALTDSLPREAEHTLSSSFLIRSLALTTFSPASSPASTVLFCGLGDGSLTSFSVTFGAEGAIDPKTEKTVQLGRRPLLLSEVESGADGERAVWVASERPTVVNMAKGGRLSYAGVNYSDLSAVCALPLPSSSSAPLLALSSPTALTLARLPAASTSGGQQVSVLTVPLDEDEPRRIAHDRKGRCFAVVCAKRDVDRERGGEGMVGRVRVVEEEDLSTRATLTLPPQEEGQSITPLPRLSRSSDAAVASLASPTQSLFLLGTVHLDLSVPEPTEGRLVLLRTTAGSPEVEQLASRQVGGCVYAVVALKGEGLGEYFAAAVNSQVCVLRVVAQEGGAGVALEVVATWSGGFTALLLAAAPNGTIVVGDAIRSMAVLRFSLPSSSAPAIAGGAIPKPKLEELGKDYRSLYMAQVEALSSSPESAAPTVERYIGADTDMNLFTVERDPQAGVRNLADAGTLTPAAAWHLGETVTRFKHGSFGQLLGSSSPSPSAATDPAAPSIRPQLVYTTTAGSVGVILELDDETSRVLSELERNMRAVEGFGKSAGGLEQEDFRIFKTEQQRLPSAGIIDGSFVEQFLDLSPSQQDAVVAGRSEHEKLSRGREEVVRLVEEVARAH